jgi:preprotein translocase subunit SecE
MSFSSYLKESRAEMNHVSWPTQAQTITYTVVVVVLSIATALLLGAFDFIFTKGLEFVVNNI